MARNTLRRHLSMPALLEAVRQYFETIPDPVKFRKFKLADCLMCGLSLYLLKFSSLLEFDKTMRRNPNAANSYNLWKLMGVKEVPSDSCLRERLDRVDIGALRVVFKIIFAKLQRGGALKRFEVLGGHYLVSIDGTQTYSSEKVHCRHCCTRHHKGGGVTYFHQMLGAALVHPDHSIVIPLAPEMIVRQDGVKKNDCERNAALRFLADLRREHPKLNIIVLEDALSSNGPHIDALRDKNMRFILGAKENDHKFLFAWVDKCDAQTKVITKHTPKGEVTQYYRWLNDVPLNETHSDVRVNFLEYKEIGPSGKPIIWTWVTDLELNEKTVMQIVRAARSRWRIENEVFQTLKKSNGYNIEHNFGHGENSLCSVLMSLATLALLIDQTQELCCSLFQQALTNQDGKSSLWKQMQHYFFTICFDSWRIFWKTLSQPPPRFYAN